MSTKTNIISDDTSDFFSIIKHNITPIDFFILSKLNQGFTLEDIIKESKNEFNLDQPEEIIKKRWEKLLSENAPEDKIILKETPQYIVNPTKLYSQLFVVFIKANLDLSDNITVDVSVQNIFDTILALNNKPCYANPIKQLFTVTGWTYDYIAIVYENNLERFTLFRNQLLEEGIVATVDIIPIDTGKGFLFDPVSIPDYSQFKQFLIHYRDRMNEMINELSTKNIDKTKTMRFFDKDDYILEMIAGKQKGEIFPVDAAEIKIGRFYDNDIILQDVVVSRRHAKIVKIGNQYFFKDQSTNGSYVNNTKLVYDEMEIKSGDIISVGKHKMKFQKAGIKKKKC